MMQTKRMTQIWQMFNLSVAIINKVLYCPKDRFFPKLVTQRPWSAKASSGSTLWNLRCSGVGVDFINSFVPLHPTFAPCAQLLRSFLLAQMLGAGPERSAQSAIQFMKSTLGIKSVLNQHLVLRQTTTAGVAHLVGKKHNTYVGVHKSHSLKC